MDEEIDPSEYRQSQKESLKDAAASSFESVAREWFAMQEPNWAPSHSSKVIARLENDVFPWIGKKQIGKRDIAADLRGALAPFKRRHFAAVTEPVAVGRLLRQIDAYEGSYIVRAALHLAPLVFVRPGGPL